MSERFIRWFEDLSIDDIPQVGGKNASLGELYREFQKHQINVPNGFAITADAYRHTLKSPETWEQVLLQLDGLDTGDVKDLSIRGKKIRHLIRSAPLPSELQQEIIAAYHRLCEEFGEHTDVAVRSSATAEDLPDASFAGQQESYLNIRGDQALLVACQRCFASLFTDRAISYRVDKGFDHTSIALSIGVQKMVRSDISCSGVMFSIDTESGFQNAVLITGTYGLGETIVQGAVNPDEYLVFKPTLRDGFRPIISKTIGSKRIMMVYDEHERHPTKNVSVPRSKREQLVLDDDEILTLAKWAIDIEDHYSARHGRFTPMDIEWAKDGFSGELFVVQARPETVVSQQDATTLEQYILKEKGEVLTHGRAVGKRIGKGKARIIESSKDIEKFQPGEVLVTTTTDPDWEPIMKIAAAIVTDKGGRTSHAAIISRELGIPCIVGCTEATTALHTGEEITVSCAEGDEGKVYRGACAFEVLSTNLTGLPRPDTKVMMNVGNPDAAFELSFLPNDGVGLARLEFIINSYVRIHPRALLEFDSIEDREVRREILALTHQHDHLSEYFVEHLAEGVGRIVAAFYPKPVIVRMSDFKSNEYANLIGGHLFEPHEENPMIGWRGASRYYREGYREGFALECLAMRKVREEFGLTNLKLMIPFCRTVEEAKKVVDEMRQHGLVQGKNGLEIYGMCEIPSNVLLAEEFLEVFDGFSIGTNDLTQLILGLDRDSELVADLFDERNPAVKAMVEKVISVANSKGKYIGLCGDAPSTYPEFAEFLVSAGIGSLSLSPDVITSTWIQIAKMEQQRK